MSKNLWQRERKELFRSLVGQYKSEGYNDKESRRLARLEADEIMDDKESFVEDIWRKCYGDRC